MSRIYVTQADHNDPYAPEIRAGWFSPDAARYWHGSKEVFDGANLADVNTRDQNSGQGLYRTAQGRWVLRYWSNWQGTTDAYSYTSPEDAREWLLFNEYDDAARELFGEIPEEQGPVSAGPPRALAFARWLQSIDVRLIGEDVNLDYLYAQWTGEKEPHCNHDPAALNPVEVNQCECGAIVPLLPDEDDNDEEAVTGCSCGMADLGAPGHDDH